MDFRSLRERCWRVFLFEEDVDRFFGEDADFCFFEEDVGLRFCFFDDTDFRFFGGDLGFCLFGERTGDFLLRFFVFGVAVP